MTNYYRIPLNHTGQRSTSVNGTEYYHCGQGDGLVVISTETNAQIKYRIATKFKNLRTYISANSAGVTTTIKLRINGADGTNSVSISAGATGWFEDTTDTDTISAGDTVNYSLAKADANSITIKTIAIDALALSPYQKGAYMVGGTNLSTASTSTYIPFGASVQSTNEGIAQKRRIRSTCTGKNLQLYVGTNLRSTTTTFKSRKNGADGNMSVSISAGATGYFEDTSNSDSLADGDDYNAVVVTGTGTGSFTVWHCSADIEGSTSTSIATGGAGGTLSTNQTRYLYPTGGMTATIESAEANAQLRFRGTGTIQKFAVGSGTNGSNQTTTYTFRKGAVDQTPTCTIAATTTGFGSDNTNSFTYADADLLSVKAVRASGGSGTIATDWIVCELIPDAEDISESTFKPQTVMFM